MIQNKYVSSLYKYLLFICLAASFFIPRAVNIGQYVTADEAKWVMRSGNFYYALATGNFAQTYQREHPGVTIMWAGTAAYLFKFPDYVRFGPRNFTRPQLLQNYLRDHQQEPLEILALARGFMVLACGASLLLVWLCMVSLVGLLPATLGFLLVSFDPFYTGLSRLLHLDALSSTLMLLSLSAWLAYNRLDRKASFLLLSGIAAGLSWLTKSPAFFLIPMIGLFQLGTLWSIWRNTQEIGFKALWQAALPVLYWILIGAGVFVTLWPSMWVNPLGTLQQVFAQASSYAFEGHESATYFMGEIYTHGIPVWYFYPVIILWRTTPVILMGLLLAFTTTLYRYQPSYPKAWQRWMQTLAVFAFLFLLFMSVGAKKFDRYIVPVFLSLDIIAGFGWAILLQELSKRYHFIFSTNRWQFITAMVIGITVLGLQAGWAICSAPYYLSYYNPLMGGQAHAPKALMIGWGEGIDQAARYLNTLPGAYKMSAAAWYGEGCLSYFFEGTMLEIDLDTHPNDLGRADYAVIYIHQWQRQLPNQELLDIFANSTPEYTVRIGNLEYVHIYNLRKSPQLANPN